MDERKDNVVHDNGHATTLEKIEFLSGSPNDNSTLFTNTYRYSKSNYKSLSNVTPYKGHLMKIIVKMTSYPLLKDSIYPREGTEPYGNKHHYEGSENSHIELSRGEKDIQFYEDNEKYLNKNREDDKTQKKKKY